MGSLERKMRRTNLRKEYEDFTKEWRLMKHSGQLVNGKTLGKKPGFSEFKRRLALIETNKVLEAENKRHTEDKNIDLTWDDK
jgi:hypothetical protein